MLRAEDIKPTVALWRWGKWNVDTNREAIRIARQRGATALVHHLEDYARTTKLDGTRAKGKRSGWKGPERDARSWLKRPARGTCAEDGCNRQTARTYNGYYQCPTCAAKIVNAGGREALRQRERDAKLRELAKAHQQAEKPDAPIQPDEVIPPHEAAYEAYEALTAGEQAAEAAIQRANAELIQVGMQVYEEAKRAA